MAFPFQVSEVVRPLRVDAQHAITLSLRLQRRASKKLSPAARKELTQLEVATARLNEDVASEVASAPAADPRPVARAAIGAWGVLHQRLDSVARLDAATVPEADEARGLLDAVFAEGVAFTRGDYETVWLRGQHTLDAIAQGGHADAVARLAGDFVLRAVRAAHHALGVALGLAGSTRAPAVETADPEVARRVLLDAVTEAIARYAHQVTAVDADDPAAVAEAARALDPILKFRAKAKATRGAADDGEPDADPVTETVVAPNTPAANDADAAKRHVA